LLVIILRDSTVSICMGAATAAYNNWDSGCPAAQHTTAQWLHPRLVGRCACAGRAGLHPSLRSSDIGIIAGRYSSSNSPSTCARSSVAFASSYSWRFSAAMVSIAAARLLRSFFLAFSLLVFTTAQSAGQFERGGRLAAHASRINAQMKMPQNSFKARQHAESPLQPTLTLLTLVWPAARSALG
jgi:hypothetical protein